MYLRRCHAMAERWRRVPILLGLATLFAAGACKGPPKKHPEDVRRLLQESPAPTGAQFKPLPPDQRPALFGEDAAGFAMYQIGARDVLHIWGDTDFLKGFGETSKGEVVGTRVKPDGQVYLPVLGAVPAQGLTVIQLQDELRERLTKYKANPFVSVDLLEARSQKFYVLGAVGSPGVYPVDGSVTLLEGFSAAGGPSDDADLQNAYVIRESKILPVSLADILIRGDTSRNVRMRHGDLVFVPSRKDAEVYVLGEVLQPGPVRMDDGRISLITALSMARGLRPETADENLIQIYRGGWANPTCFTIGACEAYQVGGDIGLHPGDRVLVAPTGLANFWRATQLVQPFITATTTTALTALGIAAATK